MNLDIMQAPLGANPSFVWRSICWGRELIKEGLKWRIEDSKTIDAGFRNWFNDWTICGRSTCMKQGAKVSDYLNADGDWNQEAVRNDFMPFEAEEILAKKVELSRGSDIRFWSFHPKGKYTVRSGYLRAIQIMEANRDLERLGCSSGRDDWWSLIWQLRIPPKVRIFWWQLSGISFQWRRT